MNVEELLSRLEAVCRRSHGYRSAITPREQGAAA